MTGVLEARLTVHVPGEPGRGEHVTVQGPDEVAEFVSRLARPGVHDAYVTHSGRPAQPIPELNDGDPTPIPDHVVALAVRSGRWGYFSYTGAVGDGSRTFDGFAIGDPDSPQTYAVTTDRFPAGTGLSLALFARAVTEFVVTADLPTCVEWVAEDDALAGRVPGMRAD